MKKKDNEVLSNNTEFTNPKVPQTNPKVPNEEGALSESTVESTVELSSEELEQAFNELISNTGETVSFTYGYEDSLIMEDYRDRKIYINRTINSDVADMLMFFILRYNAEDKDIPIEERKPIRIFLSTNGGEVNAGIMCMSAIKNSKTPVWTISFGQLYSMGFHIFLTGDRRFITTDTTVLHHSGSYGDIGTTYAVIDNIKFHQEQVKRLNEQITEVTKISPRMLKNMEREEKYWFAEEALELGIATDIIGVTTDLDTIL